MMQRSSTKCRFVHPCHARLFGTLVPGVLLALMPKCPLCVAGWAAALGLVLPAATAGVIRQLLIALCLVAMLVSIALWIRSIYNSKHHVCCHNTDPE